MRALTHWKVNFLEWLIAKMGLGFFLILHGEEEIEGKIRHNGCSVWDTTDTEHITSILQSTIDNVPEARDIIFKSVIPYLKRYEVDCKNFLEELKKD